MKQIKTTISKLYNALLLIRRLKGITDHMLHVLQVPLNISNTQDIEMVNEKLDDALETLDVEFAKLDRHQRWDKQRQINLDDDVYSILTKVMNITSYVKPYRRTRMIERACGRQSWLL